MQTPDIPDYEPERLAALQRLNLLDTESESRFDRITRLAQRLFQVPIALVSLVDSDRQWFKSKQGLDACETGRDISFCGHAILGSGIFEIPDATQDTRFADNPLVTGAPDIRFYAGAPLQSADGFNIGTLCLIDTQPRHLTDEQRQDLLELAGIVSEECNRQLLQEQSALILQEQQRIDVIARAQSTFISSNNKRAAFEVMLNDLLTLTGSEYGFIGEVLRGPDGAPYLKTYAITNIAWDDDTRAFYDTHAPAGMEFRNLDTLFGYAIRTGEVVIANHPASDNRRGGLPPGHPAMNAFLGLPVMYDGRQIAMVGMANRAGGYHDDLVEYLQPILLTLGQLVDASQTRQAMIRTQNELHRLVLAAEHTADAMVIIGNNGRIEWCNSSFRHLLSWQPQDAGRHPFLMPLLKRHCITHDPLADIEWAMAQGMSFSHELLIENAHAHPDWVRVTGDPAPLEQEQRSGGYVVTLEVISQQKMAADMLEKSEQQFRSLVNNIPGITYRCLPDAQRTMLYMSTQCEQMTGYPAREFTHNAIRSFKSIIHPADLDTVERSAEEALRNTSNWVVEYRILHQDGSIRWVQERGTMALNQHERAQFCDGFILDITAEKQLRADHQRQIEALTVLNEIASNASMSIPEQTQRALELGADFLGQELGILSRIEGDHYRIRAFIAPPDIPLKQEQIFELGSTYCSLALSHQDVLAIDHMGESQYQGHPCYANFQLESYIGIPLIVDDELYGTLNFSSAIPRSQPFTDGELMFMRLLGRWAASAIGRNRSLRALQQNENRLRSLFELSPLGIALNSFETGNFIDANPALQKLTGYTMTELYRMDYWKLTPEDYREQEQEQLRLLSETGQYGPYEKEYIHKDGSRKAILLNGMLVSDNTGRKLIWSMIEDISERKRIERMKSEFIATVSHELRTPLTAISGALGLLAGGVAGELSDDVQDMVNIAHNNSLRLGFLINDLLDMEKLVAGKMTFRIAAHSLDSLLQQACMSNQPYADSFQVRLQLDDVPDNQCIQTDPDRFAQIMANLLSNASKFSPAGSSVHISAQHHDEYIRISVRDAGPGIPAEFRDRIFQKFSQADSSDTRRKGGTGLGLAITRELVERMGGRVGFDSEEGHGATFWFDCPLTS